jgi:hypothetical protein
MPEKSQRDVNDIQLALDTICKTITTRRANMKFNNPPPRFNSLELSPYTNLPKRDDYSKDTLGTVYNTIIPPTQSIYTEKTLQMELDMRRKAEILLYKANATNTKTNDFTKADKWRGVVKSFNPQKLSSSQLVIKKLGEKCTATSLYVTAPKPSSSSGVPGPNVNLYYNPLVPLYNYRSNLHDRSYSTLRGATEPTLHTEYGIDYNNEIVGTQTLSIPKIENYNYNDVIYQLQSADTDNAFYTMLTSVGLSFSCNVELSTLPKIYTVEVNITDITVNGSTYYSSYLSDKKSAYHIQGLKFQVNLQKSAFVFVKQYIGDVYIPNIFVSPQDVTDIKINVNASITIYLPNQAGYFIESNEYSKYIKNIETSFFYNIGPEISGENDGEVTFSLNNVGVILDSNGNFSGGNNPPNGGIPPIFDIFYKQNMAAFNPILQTRVPLINQYLTPTVANSKVYKYTPILNILPTRYGHLSLSIPMGVLISTGSSKPTTVRIYEFKVKIVRNYTNTDKSDYFIMLADHEEYDASGMIVYPLANDKVVSNYMFDLNIEVDLPAGNISYTILVSYKISAAGHSSTLFSNIDNNFNYIPSNPGASPVIYVTANKTITQLPALTSNVGTDKAVIKLPS